MKRQTVKRASVLAIVLAVAAFELLCAAGALAEGSESTEPPPAPVVTPEVERIVINSTPSEDAELGAVERPIPTINEYEWSEESVRTMARYLYAFDSFKEKFLAGGVVMNRWLCGKTNPDGTVYFGKGTVESVITQRGEFECYDRKAKVTDRNLDYAEFIMNVHATRFLTGKYTGYIFPNNVLYLGWEQDGRLAAYVTIDGDPFYAEVKHDAAPQ